MYWECYANSGKHVKCTMHTLLRAVLLMRLIEIVCVHACVCVCVCVCVLGQWRVVGLGTLLAIPSNYTVSIK